MRMNSQQGDWARGIGLLVVFLLIGAQSALAERVKDLASVAGVRNNQLAGYGLVVGLNGTGDQTTQTPFTVQSIVNMLTQFGVTIPPGVSLQLKNVAAVTVQAELPPFSKPGQTIDVTVASIGNAKSLRGGSLLMAPLRGADGNVYAIAQGNLIVGGFGASGADGSRVVVNIPSAGRIPNGATVERAVPNDFLTNEAVVLNLHTPDFTTSNRLAAQINETMGPGMGVDRCSIGCGSRTCVTQPPHGIRLHARESRCRAWRGDRESHRQFTYRNCGDRRQCPRYACGGVAWFARCNDQRTAVCKSADCPVQQFG